MINLEPMLVVDDDPRLRARLQRLLQACGVGLVTLAPDLQAARAHARCGDFAAALVDVGLPDGSGIELLREMHQRCPQMVLVVVSAYGEADTVIAALRAGAVGYLLKERDDDELVAALASMQRGSAPIDPFVARGILAQWAQPVAAPRMQVAPPVPPADNECSDAGQHPDHLSAREREILTLVARGLSNREIAEMLGLSRFTIEDHTKRIYRKLAVTSRTEAVFEAQTKGLLG